MNIWQFNPSSLHLCGGILTAKERKVHAEFRKELPQFTSRHSALTPRNSAVNF